MEPGPTRMKMLKQRRVKPEPVKPETDMENASSGQEARLGPNKG